MSIINQLASENYIVVNKTLIKLFGLEEAVLLGELCSEYAYWEREDKLEDNMFYSTMENIEENTGLSPYQQRNAIQHLMDAGIIRTELKGMPAVKWFEIDEAQLLKNLTTRCEKTSQQDVKKFNINNNKNNNKNKKNISKDILQDVVEKEPALAKLKSKGKNLFQKCIDLINDFTDDEDLRHDLTECFKLFSENSREAGRPFYANNFKGKLNTLSKLSTNTEIQSKIVKQTLDNGWQNFYELKDNITKKKSSSRYTSNEPTDMGYVVDRADRRNSISGEKF